MKINLLTDAPKHNLALAKISAYHKARGDQVKLNAPLTWQADFSYGSYLFDFSPKYPCDLMGGPGIDPGTRLKGFDDIKPDYELFSLNYSLGFTWEWCPRHCGFCIVPKQKNPREHHSIWDFHDNRFNKICLLNNNTFSDPRWLETFEEIWDAKLTIIDENGYDLRLLDEEKAEALRQTKFQGYIHFAWDRMPDEAKILKALKLAKNKKLRAVVYVLMGYDTTPADDLYRCQKIHDSGFDPFPMLYKRTTALRRFRRFIYLRYYRSYPTLEVAWQDYRRQP